VSFVEQDSSCLSLWYTQMVPEPEGSFFIYLEVRELFFARSLCKTCRLGVQALSLAYEIF
jgi:hypothetical protein